MYMDRDKLTVVAIRIELHMYMCDVAVAGGICGGRCGDHTSGDSSEIQEDGEKTGPLLQQTEVSGGCRAVQLPRGAGAG